MRQRTWKAWTAGDEAYMRRRYPHDRTVDIAALLGRTRKSVLMRAKSLGLKKTDAYLDAHGGKFDPGQHCHRKQPVGTERVNYWGVRERKIRDNREPGPAWRAVHVLMWEQANGPVPDGHVVVFADRDATNIQLSNLLLVSYAENMRRNTIHRYPVEIVQTMRLCGRLKKRIRAYEERA